MTVDARGNARHPASHLVEVEIARRARCRVRSSRCLWSRRGIRDDDQRLRRRRLRTLGVGGRSEHGRIDNGSRSAGPNSHVRCRSLARGIASSGRGLRPVGHRVGSGCRRCAGHWSGGGHQLNHDDNYDDGARNDDLDRSADHHRCAHNDNNCSTNHDHDRSTNHHDNRSAGRVRRSTPVVLGTLVTALSVIGSCGRRASAAISQCRVHRRRRRRR